MIRRQKAKDDIKKVKCKSGYIERFHYNKGNIPSNLKVFSFKEDFHGTAYRLNGQGHWYDSRNFKDNVTSYLHFREDFNAEHIWEKMLRE